MAAEYLLQLGKAEKRRQYQAYEKALWALSAPYIGRYLASQVAAPEDREIFPVGNEHLRYLEFSEGTQEAEIILSCAEVLLLIFMEVLFKLKAL